MILYVTAPRFNIQTHEWFISIYRSNNEVSRIRSEDYVEVKKYFDIFSKAMVYNTSLQHQR